MSGRNMHTVGELPEELSVRILRVLGEDSKFDLASVVKSKVATPEQIATHAARLAFDGGWHERMDLWTHDQIVHACEGRFTPPPEGERIDPVAESAQRQHDERDPWKRHEAIHDPRHVTVIGGGDLGIRDERQGRS